MLAGGSFNESVRLDFGTLWSEGLTSRGDGCVLAPAGASTEPEQVECSTELPAAEAGAGAAGTASLSLTGGAVSRPDVSRNRLPGDASSFPEAAPGRLLRRAPSPLTMGELWKGVILTLVL